MFQPRPAPHAPLGSPALSRPAGDLLTLTPTARGADFPAVWEPANNGSDAPPRRTDRHHHRARTTDHIAGLSPAAAAAHGMLLHRLPRPRQRRLRLAHHEQGVRLLLDGLRLRRRHLLPR